MNGYRLAQAILRRLDPETAHDLTLWLLRRGLGPVARAPDDPILATRVWGREVANPIGLAAGFDKNAAVAGPMLRLGFGFIEVGSITPAPQPGNPRPRVFRLAEDEAVINRLGFPSEGMAVAAERLRRWRAANVEGLIGVNLGKNRETQDAAADYAAGRHRAEAGGLSGRPLFAGSTAVLGGIYRLTEGRVPLVGVGGVASAADAYAKIRAGASLVQLYTALVYQGPGLVTRIKTGLAELLRRDGFTSLAEAVGADHR